MIIEARLRQTACAILTGLMLTGGTQTSAQDAEPVRRALLIGINEYASENVPNLRGAVNDVTMLRRILTTRFGFDEDNVALLTDADATRDGILDALTDIVEAAGPDDIVYIHYSGHGSQITDANGDEADDGLDETILPHDARTQRIPDIVDDEFERLFSQIDAARTFIVFDSCNSGTITRSATAVQARAVPPDTRTELYENIAITRAVVDVAALTHVLMTGAPAEEEALDGPVDDGWYGLFSYSLAQSMDSLGPEATAVAIHDRVRAELDEIQQQLLITAPEPQLEGPTAELERPLLAVARNSATPAPVAASAQALVAVPAPAPAPVEEVRRAWLPIEPIDDATVRLLDGLSLNARPGSQWGIYAADETQFAYGGAIALGVVESNDGFDAIVNIRYVNGAIPADGRAIRLAPATIADHIPVRIEGLEDDRRRRRRLESALNARMRSLEFVGVGEFARFILSWERSYWEVKDASGLTTALSLPDLENYELVGQLTSFFSSNTDAATLLALDNPLSDIQLTARLVESDDAGSARGITVGPRPAPTLRVRQSGEPRTFENSLMIEISVDRDAYITIVDIDTEGALNLLFPNDYQDEDFVPDGRVTRNVPVRIPDSLSPGNSAGFNWDIIPPTGSDTIKVIATTDQDVAQTIRQFVRAAEDRSATLETLRSALSGGAVSGRGVGVVANTADDPGAEPVLEVFAGSSVDEEADTTYMDWVATSLVVEVTD